MKTPAAYQIAKVRKRKTGKRNFYFSKLKVKTWERRSGMQNN